MTTHLATDAVATTLAKLAEQYPDHDGSGAAHGSPDMCRYLYQDGTRCIAGQALHDLGVDSELYDGSTDSINVLLDNLSGTITYDEDAAMLLEAAQDAQDYGHPWKRSVENAFDEVGITHPKGA